MKRRISCALLVLLLLNACSQSAASWQEQYDLGVRYLTQGSYEEAIIAFQAAIEIDPKQADAYIGLADAYIARGDVEQARQVLTDALAVVNDPSAIQSRLDGLEGGAAPEPAPGTTVGPAPETDNPEIEAGSYVDFWDKIQRESSYMPDGTLLGYTEFQHNERGQVSAWRSYDSDGNLDEYGEYIFDEQNRRVKGQIYEPDGTLMRYQTYVYNETGQMAEAHGYYLGGTEYYDLTVFYYDERGLPNKCEYSADGESWGYSIFECDENGNLSKETYYNPDGTVGMYSICE